MNDGISYIACFQGNILLFKFKEKSRYIQFCLVYGLSVKYCNCISNYCLYNMQYNNCISSSALLLKQVNTHFHYVKRICGFVASK